MFQILPSVLTRVKMCLEWRWEGVSKCHARWLFNVNFQLSPLTNMSIGQSHRLRQILLLFVSTGSSFLTTHLIRHLWTSRRLVTPSLMTTASSVTGCTPTQTTEHFSAGRTMLWGARGRSRPVSLFWFHQPGRRTTCTLLSLFLMGREFWAQECRGNWLRFISLGYFLVLILAKLLRLRSCNKIWH